MLRKDSWNVWTGLHRLAIARRYSKDVAKGDDCQHGGRRGRGKDGGSMPHKQPNPPPPPEKSRDGLRSPSDDD